MELKRLFALAAATLLSACAMSQPLPPAKPIKSVALAVAIPDTLSLHYVGITVFNNVEESVPTDWHLGDLAAEVARRQLGGRYEMRPLIIDGAALKGIRTRSDSTTRSFAPVTAKLKQMVQPGVADVIVLLDGMSTDHEADALYKASHNGASLGSRLGQGVSVGVMFEVSVYDGQTFEPIAFTYERAKFINSPEPLWRGQPWDTVAPNLKDIIRSMAESYVRQTVPQQLEKVGLIR